MESQSIMDKKVLSRGSVTPSKNGQEPPLKDYYAGKKGTPSYGSRRRENDKTENARKPSVCRGGRTGQRNVRPREKTGGQVIVEEGSLYNGRKKQNITHLMDWWGPSHGERVAGQRRNWSTKGGAKPKRNSTVCHKYNKEHYLQANCQFIVMTGEDYTVYEHDPDTLVEWNLVEEVRLHMSAAPDCPICLHPPIAAKVTRCGHIYCYSCILHYLALSDDNWRKCPICDEEVVKDDLKSVVYVIHQDYQLGEEITLQLMRRERDSLVAVPVSEYTPQLRSVDKLTNYEAITPYNKLLTATNSEVCDLIIAREERELNMQLLEEGDQPEACFTEEALKLLETRKNNLMSLHRQLSNLTLLDNSTSVADKTEYKMSIDYPDKNGNPPSNFDLAPQKNGEYASVTAEDLDISQLQPLGRSDQMQKNLPKPTFYFYQATNGAHMYLHALNVQMLVHEYGSLDKCPLTIVGKILEKESASMTEELRYRLRYLRHLPVTCSFEVVEINLGQPTISALTVTEFQTKVDVQRRKRNKKAKEERKIEKRVQAEEDRIYGRLPGMKMHLQSTRHFPTFAEDLPVSPIALSDVNMDVNPAVGPLTKASSEADSSPSFAQMIREQPQLGREIRETGGWPCHGGGGSHQSSEGPANAWNTTGTRTRRTTECSEEDAEDSAPVPEYKKTFSDAFAIALDAAAKRAQEKQETSSESSNSNKGKKKKRQKGIVLLSSGGI